MKKRIIAVLILINVLLFANIISAVTTAVIKVDGKNYNLDLKSIGRESALLKINSENKSLRTVQASPYNLEVFAPSMPEVRYVLTELHTPTYLGDIKFINILVFIEKNLSSSKKINIAFNEKNYELGFVDVPSASEANIRLNNDSVIKLNLQTAPYSIQGITPTSELKYIVNSIEYPNSFKILLGFEVNLIIECVENWSCSNWSSCENYQQTRVCEDINSCGYTSNIPATNQSCSGAGEANETSVIIADNTTQTTCINECNSSGIKTCFNDSSYKSCFDNDNDNCTEWSNPILCSNDSKKICKNNGECVSDSGDYKNLVIWISEILFGVIVVLIILAKLGVIRFKTPNHVMNSYLNYFNF